MCCILSKSPLHIEPVCPIVTVSLLYNYIWDKENILLAVLKLIWIRVRYSVQILSSLLILQVVWEQLTHCITKSSSKMISEFLIRLMRKERLNPRILFTSFTNITHNMNCVYKDCFHKIVVPYLLYYFYVKTCLETQKYLLLCYNCLRSICIVIRDVETCYRLRAS